MIARATPTRFAAIRASAIAAVLLAALAGCAQRPPPDLRAEMTEAIGRLGVRPIFPLAETHRIGAVHLVDAAAAAPDAGGPSWQDNALLLTEALVPAFEARRRARPPMTERFPQSAARLATTLRPNSGQAFHRQLPAAAADAPPAEALALAALPGFTLAATDGATLGGVLPGPTASLAAALGLRQQRGLRLEAEGVELAELPLDQIRAIVAAACGGDPGRSVFGGDGAGGHGLVALGYAILDQQRGERGPAARAAAPQPILALLRRVVYLRGVRFVVTDRLVASALLQAAAPAPAAEDGAPVPLPALRTRADAARAPGDARAAETAAALAALQDQIEQLRGALAAAGGAQLGIGFVRAAATGIELVQLFDRPLAFGYQAVFVDARRDRQAPASPDNLDGLRPLCRAI